MLTLSAIALLFLALWILVPAPTVWLYPLSVGAPEVSPILLALSALVFVLALRKLRTRKVAVLFSLAAIGISAMPISKLPDVTRAFDADLERVFPSSARRPMPDGARAGAFNVRDLLTGIPAGDVRVHSSLQFATPEGFPLVLDVYRPAASGLYPAIVQFHGGAWQRGSRTDNETVARYFASRGYVVFAPEYRHAPRSKWPKALEDARAAVAFVRDQGSRYEADTSRLVLMGRSAGAHLAMLAAFTSGARAVISYYGPTDLEEGWREVPNPDPLDVRSILETFLGGTPNGLPDQYRAASPVTYISAGGPPTLLVYGARDHVVLPRFGRDLHAKLKALGARSVLLEIPWAEHAFDTLPNGLSGQLALYGTERFLAAALSTGR